MGKLETFGIVPQYGRETHLFHDAAVGGEKPFDVAVEKPVAMEVDGFGLGVMMATPIDLEDFATGFAVAEGLLEPDVLPDSIQVADVPDGVIVRMQLSGADRDTVRARVRSRLSESACGLCGMESLAALAVPLPPIAQPVHVSDKAVTRALSGLRDHQPLSGITQATHAAALCDADGTIVLAREDVGPHNALDKLVGGAMRSGLSLQGRFVLMTSRLSFELVEKAARAGIGALVTLSAPTSLALHRAKTVGLPVIVRARPNASRRAV